MFCGSPDTSDLPSSPSKQLCNFGLLWVLRLDLYSSLVLFFAYWMHLISERSCPVSLFYDRFMIPMCHLSNVMRFVRTCIQPSNQAQVPQAVPTARRTKAGNLWNMDKSIACKYDTSTHKQDVTMLCRLESATWVGWCLGYVLPHISFARGELVGIEAWICIAFQQYIFWHSDSVTYAGVLYNKGL